MIPVVEAEGAPRDAGYAVGTQCARQLAHLITCARDEAGSRWGRFVDRAGLYLEATRLNLPRRAAEVEGVADGAKVPLKELFAVLCLEEHEIGGRGCTDFCVAGPATGGQGVYACHNEDWNQEEIGDLVVVRGRVEGEVPFLAVAYGGLMPSIGMNRAGLAVTGNALDQNDVRPGVPRVVLVREAIGCPGAAEALAISALPDRASSYNNVFTLASGDIYNFEGSATAFEITHARDYSVHTNHYLAPRMKAYEADPLDMGTVVRLHTARRLVEEQAGHITEETCQRILRDHTNAPYSICRHPRLDRPASQTVTTFSAICDVGRRRLWLCPGRPCEGEYSVYEVPGGEGA